MNQKIISERCIGYQKVMGRADAVIEQILENGELQWEVTRHRENELPVQSLPLKTKPHIDIVQEI